MAERNDHPPDLIFPSPIVAQSGPDIGNFDLFDDPTEDLFSSRCVSPLASHDPLDPQVEAPCASYGSDVPEFFPQETDDRRSHLENNDSLQDIPDSFGYPFYPTPYDVIGEENANALFDVAWSGNNEWLLPDDHTQLIPDAQFDELFSIASPSHTMDYPSAEASTSHVLDYKVADQPDAPNAPPFRVSGKEEKERHSTSKRPAKYIPYPKPSPAPAIEWNVVTAPPAPKIEPSSSSSVGTSRPLYKEPFRQVNPAGGKKKVERGEWAAKDPVFVTGVAPPPMAPRYHKRKTQMIYNDKESDFGDLGRVLARINVGSRKLAWCIAQVDDVFRNTFLMLSGPSAGTSRTIQKYDRIPFTIQNVVQLLGRGEAVYDELKIPTDVLRARSSAFAAGLMAKKSDQK